MPPALPAAPPPAALVTGGARRIGRAIVLALAGAGYAVAIHTNRSRAAAEELRAALAREGRRAAVVTADLADHEAVLRVAGRGRGGRPPDAPGQQRGRVRA